MQKESSARDRRGTRGVRGKRERERERRTTETETTGAIGPPAARARARTLLHPPRGERGLESAAPRLGPQIRGWEHERRGGGGGARRRAQRKRCAGGRAAAQSRAPRESRPGKEGGEKSAMCVLCYGMAEARPPEGRGAREGAGAGAPTHNIVGGEETAAPPSSWRKRGEAIENSAEVSLRRRRPACVACAAPKSVVVLQVFEGCVV